jgi:hypothetical protein
MPSPIALWLKVPHNENTEEETNINRRAKIIVFGFFSMLLAEND